jgi:hypothetical protein
VGQQQELLLELPVVWQGQHRVVLGLVYLVEYMLM